MILHGLFSLLSPLSHIGDSISTDSYLNEEPVVQPNGEIKSVFVYNGNAWRGQLRDLMAMSLCERLGVKLPLPAFHLLFSGGSIGDSMNVDLAQANEIRAMLPMVSLLGGGVGNQILPGRLVVGNSYPVCRETAHLLPADYLPNKLQEYRLLTTEKSFTRTDDAKNPQRGDNLAVGDGSGSVQQMRYTVELLAAGTRLYTYLDLDRVNDLELGVLADALHRFSAKPHIGGQCSRGHGRVQLVYRLDDHYGDVRDDYWFVCDPRGREDHVLSEDARNLQLLYLAHIDEHAKEIVAVLKGVN